MLHPLPRHIAQPSASAPPLIGASNSAPRRTQSQVHNDIAAQTILRQLETALDRDPHRVKKVAKTIQSARANEGPDKEREIQKALAWLNSQLK